MSKRNKLNQSIGYNTTFRPGKNIMSKNGINSAFTPGQTNLTTQIGGCGGPFGTPGQMGGLNVGKEIKKGFKKVKDWAVKEKPLTKINNFLDKIPLVKSIPGYDVVRGISGTIAKQAGIGLIGQQLGVATSISKVPAFSKGIQQPITARGRGKILVNARDRLNYTVPPLVTLPKKPVKQSGRGKRNKKQSGGSKRST